LVALDTPKVAGENAEAIPQTAAIKTVEEKNFMV
jgi:hypothetical protein